MEYRVIYSTRKTIAIEITPNMEVIVRAPKYASRRSIEAFVESKQEWIVRTLNKIDVRKKELESTPRLTDSDIQELTQKARIVIPQRVEYYAPIVGVKYGRITIRNQATRWGSCSSKGNLNFNCKLMLTPDEIMDYVVVHELCHRLQMNHSAAFWAEVERVLPDYKERRKWLKKNGPGII